MITAEFNKLLNALTQLTDLQTKRLEKALKGENPAQIIINVLEQRLVTNPECQHCRSDRIKRNGKLNMMQRYMMWLNELVHQYGIKYRMNLNGVNNGKISTYLFN
jgi:hypothetical protein